MIIGVPKELAIREYRVGLTPALAKSFVAGGHQVLVERAAGEGAGLPDADFERVGAKIVRHADELWKRAEMIVKVKAPVELEHDRLQESQILYTFLHLVNLPELTRLLLRKKISAIAYETIQLDDGQLPLLRPMSEVAGKMSIQVGAAALERAHGGKGILLSGVPGVRRGRVAIIGGGTVGTNAAKLALGFGAEVAVLDVSLDRLTYLDDIFGGHVTTLNADSENIARAVREADLVVGAVLIPGTRAPRLVSKDLVKEMARGSAVVDVAVDQGGCIETIKVTTHDAPTYEFSGIVHYGVANMPGAVPMTSTFALTNVSGPRGLRIADLGLVEAVKQDRALARGLNTFNGHLTYEAVARHHGLDYLPVEQAIDATFDPAKAKKK